MTERMNERIEPSPDRNSAERPESGRATDDENGERRQDSGRRPYSDISNLYDIPRTGPDDPPYRDWWIDDDQKR